jgi:amino acid transporter
LANLFFVFLIIVSFVAYFYYKTKEFRTTLPIQKKWYKAKAGVALGIFVIVFGINTSVIYPTLVGFLIAAVFIIIGFMKSFTSYKRVRHEGRFVKQEYELNK